MIITLSIRNVYPVYTAFGAHGAFRFASRQFTQNPDTRAED
jgi:hypothetical protein